VLARCTHAVPFTYSVDYCTVYKGDTEIAAETTRVPIMYSVFQSTVLTMILRSVPTYCVLKNRARSCAWAVVSNIGGAASPTVQ
jgi:hypothetical protein